MTRKHVKTIAIQMIKEYGLINLSRRDLCKRANIPDGSFPHVMGCNFSEFINELKRETVETIAHVVNKSRVNPTLRRAQILNAAIEMARTHGYTRITRDNVAEYAGVSMGLVTNYFGTMKQLRRDIMRAAIKQGIPEIIAQGLVNGDCHALKAPLELKEKAATHIASS